MKKLILKILTIIIISTSCYANDYYVDSVHGSDNDNTNNGSQSLPWATITHAASKLVLGTTGTTVHVLPGNYGCTATNVSGTSTKIITYKSETILAAKLTCSSTVWINGNSSNTRLGDYVDIVGFDISGTGNDCNGLVDYGAFDVISANYVHDIPAPIGSCGNGVGGSGISLAYNGNTATAGHDNIVSGNTVDSIGYANGWCNYIHGIYPATANNQILNNLVSRACGWGIQFYHYTPLENAVGNVVINNLRGGILISADTLIATANNYTITNNIVANNGDGANQTSPQYGISEASGATGSNNVYWNNAMYNNLPTNFNFPNGSRSTTGTITLTTAQFNALFVDYTGDSFTGNYAEQTNAVTIDAGTVSCAVGGLSPCVSSADFVGNKRPDVSGTNPDIGAYEAQSLVINPPTSLSNVVHSVAFDAVGPSSVGASGTGINSLSWNHTTSTGTNRLLTVGVAVGKSVDTGLSLSVTYNGTAMTSAGSPVHSDGKTAGFTQLFYLVAPSSGTHSVVVSLSGGTADLEAGSVSFTGVNQSTPLKNTKTAIGSGTTPTVTVTSASGDIVVSTVVNGSPINSSGNTLRWLKNQNGATAGGNGAESTASGAASVTMSYSVNSDWWGIIGIDISAAVTGHIVDLSWVAAQAGTYPITGYNIYRSITSGGPYTKINSTLIAGTTYTDSTVISGTTYYYVATTVDSNNNESAFSNQATAIVPTP